MVGAGKEGAGLVATATGTGAGGIAEGAADGILRVVCSCGRLFTRLKTRRAAQCNPGGRLAQEIGEETDNSNEDEVERNDDVQQPRHDQDENAGKQR